MTKKELNFKQLKYYERKLLGKCLTMFKWNNLPKEIPEWYLNLILFTEGQIGFVKYNDKLYITTGADAGTNIDAYGRGNTFIGANPEFSINCPIVWNDDEDVPEGNVAVICWNDTFRYGILDLIKSYAHQLSECDKSINIALLNTRDTKMIQATTDNARVQAQIALDKMYEGKPYAFYDEGSCTGFGEAKSLFDNASKNNHLQDLITTRADILSRFCIEIGIPLVNNTKRSQLISGEVGGVKTLGVINIDDMLENRKHFVDLINYVFDLDVSVDLNDNWKLEVEDLEETNDNSYDDDNDVVEVKEDDDNEDTNE